MRVVVTGLGIVSAAGNGVSATTDALRAGRSGLGRLTLFDSERCAGFPVAECPTSWLKLGREPSPRAGALATIAAREAIADASLPTSEVALALGICVGGLFETEPVVAAARQARPTDDSVWPRHECGFTTDYLARTLALQGPALTVSTACSSGAQAIGLGCELLASGIAPTVLAGGVDAVTQLTFNGFMSLLAMDPDGCRPFDRRRRGMSLGEGAGFVVLEREDAARSRGANIYAEVAGYGNSCDAHHPTAPDPAGLGAEAAMRTALSRAGVTPSQVDAVNAHGTGTPDNDRSETAALRRVFGPDVPPVSSTKRIFGHTLGAAGAIEAVASILSLRHQFLPGTPGFEEVADDCLVPLRDTIEAQPEIIVSNSFGFGGNNSVLCLRRPTGVAP